MINTFIQTIVRSNELFVIEDKEGAAMSQSLLFQNEDGLPVGVICFWSDKNKAQNCCAEDWEEYRPQAICLGTFIEDYLVPVYNESLIAGLDLNESMEGTEADPLHIIELLIAELKLQNKKPELEYFKDLNDLEQQLKRLISQTIK